MTWAISDYFYEVLLNGERVETGEPLVSESLDALSTVAEFELISQPTFPDEGGTVQINRVDIGADTYIPLFGGYVTSRDTISEDSTVTVRAVDELDKFNLVRTTNDLNLTGMTDGEAWETIAGVCDVDFDPADIQDTGYVLGEQAPIYWRVGQTAATVILELDRVLGCKTLTVLNNRVVRFGCDRVGHVADIQKQYRKNHADHLGFWGNQKALGVSAQKQSIWIVRGVTTPCGTNDECSCMVWAHATDVVPKRGKKTQQSAEQVFQSDIIQDEDLAGEVARWLMRWYNRVPTTITIEAETDPNIHPGTVIGVRDETYGISDSTTKPYVVLTADKRGPTMTLTAVGGSAGSVGTITTGVEKLCNDISTDIDWGTGIGGDWDFPTVGFPPIGIELTWTGSLPDLTVSWDFIGGDFDIPPPSLGATWENDPTNPVGEDWNIVVSSIFGVSGSNGTAWTTDTIENAAPNNPKNYQLDFKINGTEGGAFDLYGEDSNTLGVHFWFGFNVRPALEGFDFMTGCAYDGGCVGEFGAGPTNPTWDTDYFVRIIWDRSDHSHTVVVYTDQDDFEGSQIWNDHFTAVSSGMNVTSDVRFTAIHHSSSGGTTNIIAFTITMLET